LSSSLSNQKSRLAFVDNLFQCSQAFEVTNDNKLGGAGEQDLAGSAVSRVHKQQELLRLDAVELKFWLRRFGAI
jgi:hypothetical protein